jgi:hypothetical protein
MIQEAQTYSIAESLGHRLMDSFSCSRKSVAHSQCLRLFGLSGLLIKEGLVPSTNMRQRFSDPMWYSSSSLTVIATISLKSGLDILLQARLSYRLPV